MTDITFVKEPVLVEANKNTQVSQKNAIVKPAKAFNNMDKVKTPLSDRQKQIKKTKRSDRSPGFDENDDSIITITRGELNDMITRAADTAVAKMSEHLNEQFRLVNDKMDQVKQEIRNDFETLREELAATNTEMDELKTDYESVKQDMLHAIERVKELETTVVELQKRCDDNTTLANDNAQFSRKESIRIHGLQPYEKGENCKAIVLKLFKEKLKIDLPPYTIHVAHRGGHKKESVLVRFFNRDDRFLILKNRKLLKGTHIGIQEDLSPLNVKLMNQLQNDERIKSTWSWNGSIFASNVSDHKTVKAALFKSYETLYAV